MTAIATQGDKDTVEFNASSGVDRWILHNKKWLRFVRDKRDINAAFNGPTLKEESLTVSLLGFSAEPVKRVIREAKELYKSKNMYSTQVYLGDGYGGCLCSYLIYSH